MSIRIVSASAGSGKTHRLSQDLLKALLEDKVRPEGVVAITYTRKAAAELESRMRRVLLEQGRPDLAARIRDGYLGTVHSVCQRLLREFALEVETSPEIEPIPEAQRRRLFHEAVAQVLQGRERELAELARRMSMQDWREDLAKLVDSARENGMGRAELAASAKQSVSTLMALLPPVSISGKEYEAKLLAELDAVLPTLEEQALSDDTKAARERAEDVRALLAACRRHGLPAWKQQVDVAAGLGAKKLAPIVGKLCALVEDHLACDAFQADLRMTVEKLFALAADALDAFTRHKQSARVLDFQDMLAQTARLLSTPACEQALKARLELVLVDEFQDTSPMQLEIVTALARLSPKSIWVGDRKQAIFGFQGSDPELMSAAVDHALGQKKPDFLTHSYRSRPALVDFVSEVFARALAPHGFSDEEVRLAPACEDPKQLAKEPVLECWPCSMERVEVDGVEVKPNEGFAIADGVTKLLAEAPLVRVRREDGGQELRKLEKRDVAVLARTNPGCQKIAAALQQRGIPVKVALSGLVGTPEALLARAALAVLADPEDEVSALEVAWLSGGAADPDAWLDERLEQMNEYRAARAKAEEEGGERPKRPLAFEGEAHVDALRAARDRARSASPSEALDLALRVVDLPAICRSWPSPEQRIANLESLRAEARNYEELCRVRRSACTVLGLVEHFRALGDDASKDEDRQAMAGEDDAVSVLTFHKSKGLEWPVVVLTELHKVYDAWPFGVNVEPAQKFDAAKPLAGRWLRYWPTPYGDKEKNLALVARAAHAPEVQRQADKERREHLRLLYVAFTRARDRLVFSAAMGKGGANLRALERLVDAEGKAVLALPMEAKPGDAAVTVGKAQWEAQVRAVDGLPAQSKASGASVVRWFAAADRVARPREILNPSGELHEAGDGVAEIVAVHPLQGRAAVNAKSEEMAAVGDAVHAFLAADPSVGATEKIPDTTRVELATRLLKSYGVALAIAPATLLAASDVLQQFVARQWPGATWHRELPVRAKVEEGGHARLLVGEVDLVLELPDALVVIDHKSFPGDEKTRNARLEKYGRQLGRYADALSAALEKPVRSVLVHFPLRGELVELAQPAKKARRASG